MTDFQLYKTYSDHMIYLGPFFVEFKSEPNVYLLDFEAHKILLDLPHIDAFDEYLKIVNQLTYISDISHIVITTIFPYTLSTLNKLYEHGFKGDILTNEFISKQLQSKDIKSQIKLIETIKYKLVLDNKQTLNFIPIRFLPSIESFMIYVPSHNTLFSNTLFSSFTTNKGQTSLETLKEEVIKFHKASCPSSDFLRLALKDIKKYTIKCVLPLYGNAIIKDRVDTIYELLTKLEFYNTYQVIKTLEDDQLVFNYIEIINHMINHLQTHFSAIDILDVFVGSPYTIGTNPLELKRSSYEGYKLWHGFFEHIYVKKGILWLSILEPIVNKYIISYNIQKPLIYSSKVIELTMHNEVLEKEKLEYQKNAERLDALVIETQESINRCPITKLYTQDFFKQMLIKDFENTTAPDKTRAFLLVQIDQLDRINQLYGKDTGDETIRNLKYIIDQNKKEDALLFKQKGPGIYIYEDDTTFDIAENCALKVRNIVEDSDLFIEKVTVSVSIVTHEEIDQTLSFDKQVDQVFQLLEQGIISVRGKGSGEIINKRTERKQLFDGVILLIDEDEINRNMIYRIFRRVNYQVVVAKDSHDALKLIEKHDVDIIISEINLTKIDGFSLKQMFNETKEYKHIPFIMVSHSKTVDNIKRGNTLDVDLMLEKPIIAEELIGHVKRFKDRNQRL
jgi:diguanylate cyclase (GGDEF)-like protein